MNRDIRLSIRVRFEPYDYQERENDYHGCWEFDGFVVDKDDNQVSCPMICNLGESLTKPHLLDSENGRLPTGQEQFEFIKRVEKMIEALEQMPNYLTGGIDYD